MVHYTLMICTYLKCDNKTHAKGLCTKHYQRYKKYGNPDIVKSIIRGSSHDHPLDNTYYNMMARCYRKSCPYYKYYGARGIKVCDEWSGENGFINFIHDMGNKPDGYSLDRIDVNKGYSKDNCRWANKFIQASNKQKKNDNVGVTWHKLRNKWRARIKINRKEIYLGLFDSYNEAVEARNKANIKYDI